MIEKPSHRVYRWLVRRDMPECNEPSAAFQRGLAMQRAQYSNRIRSPALKMEILESTELPYPILQPGSRERLHCVNSLRRFELVMGCMRVGPLRVFCGTRPGHDMSVSSSQLFGSASVSDVSVPVGPALLMHIMLTG